MKILIVEDEILIRKHLCRMVTGCGAQVVGETGYGEEVLELTRRCRPDIVLMDVALKGNLNGIDAAELIGNELNAQVLFTSANNMNQEIKKKGLKNILGYIEKPVRQKTLQVFLTSRMETSNDKHL